MATNFKLPKWDHESYNWTDILTSVPLSWCKPAPALRRLEPGDLYMVTWPRDSGERDWGCGRREKGGQTKCGTPETSQKLNSVFLLHMLRQSRSFENRVGLWRWPGYLSLEQKLLILFIIRWLLKFGLGGAGREMVWFLITSLTVSKTLQGEHSSACFAVPAGRRQWLGSAVPSVQTGSPGSCIYLFS